MGGNEEVSLLIIILDISELHHRVQSENSPPLYPVRQNKGCLNPQKDISCRPYPPWQLRCRCSMLVLSNILDGCVSIQETPSTEGPQMPFECPPNPRPSSDNALVRHFKQGSLVYCPRPSFEPEDFLVALAVLPRRPTLINTSDEQDVRNPSSRRAQGTLRDRQHPARGQHSGRYWH